MNKAELSWIAGFYEGEGSAGCYQDSVLRKSGNRHPRWSLRVTVAQNGLEVLNWMKTTVGFGSVNRFSRRTNVCAWQTSATSAAKFLLMILPYMRIPYKRRQAIKALKKYFSAVRHKQTAEKTELKEKFHALYQSR